MSSNEHPDASKLPVTSRRLSSIRPARDLTLGGVPKKTFTPVIPSRNNERATKSANASNTRNFKYKMMIRCSQYYIINYIINSCAIFYYHVIQFSKSISLLYFKSTINPVSAEPSKKEILKEKTTLSKETRQNRNLKQHSNLSTSSRNVTSQPTVFSFRKNRETVADAKMFTRGSSDKVTVKTEEMDIDSFENAYSDDEDSSNNASFTFNENTRTLPIQLPLSRCRKGKEKSILVKQEDSATKSKLTDDITPAQILVKESTKCDNGSLLLIQLPDMLPLIAQASPSEDTTEENKTNLSSLRNAKDGLIGKLQIHRSGKTSLVIGNIPYKLRSGTRCDFLQDLASIKAMENDGYVINLGPIKHRLVCTPDVEKLLKSLP
ncbi:DNA-directed RNA polymerase III subunit RPC4 [Trichoplax sp. H2]|nr:DNA-directed RNA polymerase III subunit RPC4 [Trichoplax sp. H2]|eukprot:RDD46435.1 DNA-directed RNA polymerase III subunit RPC4 [Trichoplax sp. H2]